MLRNKQKYGRLNGTAVQQNLGWSKKGCKQRFIVSRCGDASLSLTNLICFAAPPMTRTPPPPPPPSPPAPQGRGAGGEINLSNL